MSLALTLFQLLLPCSIFFLDARAHNPRFVGTDYRLVISQPSQDYLSLTDAYCYPFELSIQIQNIQNSSFVRFVEPPGADSHDPTQDLWIKIR